MGGGRHKMIYCVKTWLYFVNEFIVLCFIFLENDRRGRHYCKEPLQTAYWTILSISYFLLLIITSSLFNRIVASWVYKEVLRKQ